MEQSGTSADAARWERIRRPIVNAVDRDGSFLDVGCASGLLMESIVGWAAEDGHDIEPFGLDHSWALTALARHRLPQWADRIHTGNAIDWVPARPFDYVRTELAYVPPQREAQLVRHLLKVAVAPGGRLIVCSYGSSRKSAPRTEDIARKLRDWNNVVSGEADVSDKGVNVTRVAWVDKPR
jgi:SAM-dependent methyltransferase